MARFLQRAGDLLGFEDLELPCRPVAPERSGYRLPPLRFLAVHQCADPMQERMMRRGAALDVAEHAASQGRQLRLDKKDFLALANVDLGAQLAVEGEGNTLGIGKFAAEHFP